MWRQSMGWDSGFESSRSSPRNGPHSFPHLFWKVRENANENAAKNRMKSEFFTSRLGEKIIFGMETQGLRPRQFAIITSVVVATFLPAFYLVRVSRQRNSPEQVERK